MRLPGICLFVRFSPHVFNGLANTTATLGSFYWLGFETSGLTPDKKRLAWLGAQRLALAPRRERGPQHQQSMQNQPNTNNEAGAVAQERLVLPLESVVYERRRQDEKWGVQNHDPITWIAILTEEVGEASQEALTLRFHKGKPPANPGCVGTEEYLDHVGECYRREMIQVAAVAIAAVEAFDRMKESQQNVNVEARQK
jgi:hypothetical protein